MVGFFIGWLIVGTGIGCVIAVLIGATDDD